MSILVYSELKDGKATKSGLEAVSYAKKASAVLGGDVTVITSGAIEGDGGMGAYGADKILNASEATSDSQQLTRLVAAAAESTGADTIIINHDATGKLVAPRVAVKLNAGIVAGAIDVPSNEGGFKVKKGVFSGKAIAEVTVTSAKRVVSITPNSFGLHEAAGAGVVESFSADLGGAKVKVKEFKPTSTDGSIPLPEADLVVSAGRGLKGPENWGMIEELAKELGAATACSRPVSDIGWRPHHEHVGQTGIAIRPTLYIAVGISGAIQHLAGVNASKVIVVINKDPEAPFFKAADYGIVGDAFEVVPKLLEAVKSFKNN
ncbi:electron transfer flavoprotein subunit alpha/FixB family protein [Sanyastnella coralliicola]|uniref:electron transfer flavoprotein subunit alpha/FixB family protein n=1 Tax=Sanyastnella coralliicola TaxID=3069118 RepID=UPI0027BA97AE|nr:electron transfer flavoprotein subunit alpha/FixB family protein [Longitalea sp. SCSIO 12813]